MEVKSDFSLTGYLKKIIYAFLLEVGNMEAQEVTDWKLTMLDLYGFVPSEEEEEDLY